jgi:hypothetical protein
MTGNKPNLGFKGFPVAVDHLVATRNLCMTTAVEAELPAIGHMKID